jgi:hypothetical protein
MPIAKVVTFGRHEASDGAKYRHSRPEMLGTHAMGGVNRVEYIVIVLANRESGIGAGSVSSSLERSEGGPRRAIPVEERLLIGLSLAKRDGQNPDLCEYQYSWLRLPGCIKWGSFIVSAEKGASGRDSVNTWPNTWSLGQVLCNGPKRHTPAIKLGPRCMLAVSL